jgi:hypothetical protein
MKDLNEKNIEEFIKKNRDEIFTDVPKDNHEEKFLYKLGLRVKKFIDLTPYFVKLAIVVIMVFIISALTWNAFIRKDKNKPVIENIVDQFKKDKTKK